MLLEIVSLDLWQVQPTPIAGKIQYFSLTMKERFVLWLVDAR